MFHLSEIPEALLHLFFPHICNGCGSDMLNKESSLCIRCIERLPATGFEIQADNPIEKKFWGSMAQYYFNPQSLLQHLMH
jgi:hypothetical protein